MVQLRDFPTAWSGLSSLERLLGPQVTHHVLLNDAHDDELVAQLSSVDGRTVHCDGRNLGVAAGRNRLIEAATAAGAQFIVSLDDDLLVPVDLVERLQAAHRSVVSSGKRPGLLSPAVLDYHAVSDALHDTEQQAAVERGDGTQMGTAAELRASLRDHFVDGLPARAVYHLGIGSWRTHYLRVHGPLGRLIDEEAGHSELRHDRAARNAVLCDGSGALPVDSVPGGVSAFSVDLVQEIGSIDEGFSPFGYEDADYAIRVCRAGRHNVVVPDVAVLHDLQRRNEQREPERTIAAVARGRLMLALRHDADDPAATAVQTLLMLLRTGLAYGGEPSRALGGEVLAFVGGVLAGLERSAGGPCAAWPVMDGGSTMIEHRADIDVAGRLVPVGIRGEVHVDDDSVVLGPSLLSVGAGLLMMRVSGRIERTGDQFGAVGLSQIDMRVTDRGFTAWLLRTPAGETVRRGLTRDVRRRLGVMAGSSHMGFDASLRYCGPPLTSSGLMRPLVSGGGVDVVFKPVRLPSQVSFR
jgi:GT2 family glycosyltransferase